MLELEKCGYRKFATDNSSFAGMTEGLEMGWVVR